MAKANATNVFRDGQACSSRVLDDLLLFFRGDARCEGRFLAGHGCYALVPFNSVELKANKQTTGELAQDVREMHREVQHLTCPVF